MSDNVDRDVVMELVAEGARVVEVLPSREYDWAHLPGALSLPLRSMDPSVVRRSLDFGRPIVVYCHDHN